MPLKEKYMWIKTEWLLLLVKVKCNKPLKYLGTLRHEIQGIVMIQILPFLFIFMFSTKLLNAE